MKISVPHLEMHKMPAVSKCILANGTRNGTYRSPRVYLRPGYFHSRVSTVHRVPMRDGSIPLQDLLIHFRIKEERWKSGISDPLTEP